MLTDSAAAILTTFDYDAYGQLTAQNGTVETKYLYNGQQYDAVLDLYSLRARYYNPLQGRFLSRDKHTGNYASELNRYVYTANNPVMFGDASGMSFISYVSQGIKNVARHAITKEGVGQFVGGMFSSAAGNIVGPLLISLYKTMQYISHTDDHSAAINFFIADVQTRMNDAWILTTVLDGIASGFVAMGKGVDMGNLNRKIAKTSNYFERMSAKIQRLNMRTSSHTMNVMLRLEGYLMDLMSNALMGSGILGIIAQVSDEDPASVMFDLQSDILIRLQGITLMGAVSIALNELSVLNVKVGPIKFNGGIFVDSLLNTVSNVFVDIADEMYNF